MKLYSWNVNGIRACQKKEFNEWVKASKADVICLQEVKAEEDQVDLTEIREMGYEIYWNHSTVKKGYSGTAILTKQKPQDVKIEMNSCTYDGEGRVTAIRLKDFWVVTAYVPNSQDGFRRLEYRQKWDKYFRSYLKKLGKEVPVLVCGDFNVAHEEIDLARPDANRNKTPGFSDDERHQFTLHLKSGLVDTFRQFDPSPEKYSWWSYRGGARERNVGWRLDYWLASEQLMLRVQNAWIEPETHGSDHCPVGLSIK